MEPVVRIKRRCNKTNECSGRYPNPRKKREYQICLHHGIHDLIKSGASQPRVVCEKACHCPIGKEGAICLAID